MKKLKQMKRSMLDQIRRMAELNAKLFKLRERFAASQDISIRNEIEIEGNAVKKEMAHIDAYLVACEQAAKDWSDDHKITQLADFKYWRSHG